MIGDHEIEKKTNEKIVKPVFKIIRNASTESVSQDKRHARKETVWSKEEHRSFVEGTLLLR